jgi:dUTPase
MAHSEPQTPDIFLASSDAITPQKKRALATGYDIYAPLTVRIPAKSKHMVSTHIRVRVPPHIQVKIEPIAVSMYMTSFVINQDNIESDDSEPLTLIISNQMNTDFALPKETLLGRIIFSLLPEHTESTPKNTSETQNPVSISKIRGTNESSSSPLVDKD